MTKYYYRYDDPYIFTMPDNRSTFFKQEPDHPSLSLWPVLRETPCGVVIDHYGEEKFINNNWNKRWAYPTMGEARASYKARKRRQIRILAARHDQAVYFETLDFHPDEGKERAAGEIWS
tara:strand:+ start:75 stop:431 length:357 start_codon:yes stop_codon:yes gene_type:complete